MGKGSPPPGQLACMNPHCRLLRAVDRNKVVCDSCWGLLPRPWREKSHRLGAAPSPGTLLFKLDVRWFFDLTVLPMPPVKVLPARPWVEDKPMSEWTWAEFEIKMMQRIHAIIQEQYDKATPGDSRPLCDNLKREMLEQYQQEAAEVVKQELTRDNE